MMSEKGISLNGTEPSSPPDVGLCGESQKGRLPRGRTTGPTRHSSKGNWTQEEDDMLRKAVETYKGKNWNKIGAYLMSPAARTFDALGLVKQINEQSADALEEAHEVLASGSVKNRHKGNRDKEKTKSTTWKKELIISKLPSEVMAEARVLDFNDCSTPVRKNEDSNVNSKLGG